MTFGEIMYSSMGLLIGLALLWWAGSRSVSYAVKTTKVFGLGSFFVGFVVMAVSTGLPELAVAIFALIKGEVQLSVGDIIGSNLHDISMVIGLPILVYGQIYVRDKRDRRELTISLILAAAISAFIFLFDTLSNLHGLVLLLIYAWYMIWLSTLKRPAPGVEEHEVPQPQKDNNGRFGRYSVIFKLFASLGLMLLAAQMSVNMGLRFSHHIGISSETVGLIFFAFATSLPETILNIHAMKRKEYALALGNAIGSVFQQATCSLGILALLSPEGISMVSVRSVAPFMFAAFSLVFFTMVARGARINRYIGGFLVGIYVAFILFRMLWG